MLLQKTHVEDNDPLKYGTLKSRPLGSTSLQPAVGDLKDLCGRDPSVNDRIQVRLYDATPVLAIHGYDNTNIVGFYWQRQVSQLATQFELVSELVGEQGSSQRRSAGDSLHFSRAVDKHFRELWKNPAKSKNAKEAPEWKQA
jgi:hypothetical protein